MFLLTTCTRLRVAHSLSKMRFRDQYINVNVNHRCMSTTELPVWANVDPDQMGENSSIHLVKNLVDGVWQGVNSGETISIPDPMRANNENPIFRVVDTKSHDLGPFIDSMKRVPKSGVHNPLKNVERYLMFGEISRLAGEELTKPNVEDFFTKSIMKCVPKSYAQALGEVKVTAAFLKNFAGDQVRFLARGEQILL